MQQVHCSLVHPGSMFELAVLIVEESCQPPLVLPFVFHIYLQYILLSHTLPLCQFACLLHLSLHLNHL